MAFPSPAKIKSNGNGKKPASKPEVRILFNEAGSSGLKEWSGFVSEAYNSSLFWPNVAPLFARLRTSNPELVSISRAFTSWARNVEPVVDLPDKATDDDKKYRDFLISTFDDMEGGFTQYIETLVTRAPFDGWAWWDAQPCVRDPNWVPPPFVDSQKKEWPDDWRSEQDDGLIGLRRLAYRDSNTFFGWVFDGTKRAIGLKQQDFPNPAVTMMKDRSLHITFGSSVNPEGQSPLQAAWREERLKYGYEVVFGIGAEHTAGHLSVKKTSEGTLTDTDERLVGTAAKNLLSAQEGNYALWPFGLEGEVIDVSFQAAGAILDAIKLKAISILSLYNMQFIALNTLTNTGAQASQVDSTNSGVFAFNSMMDGFASQYDEQIGKRLYLWNKDSFPKLTRRPNIRYSHIENNIALGELGSFVTAIDGKVPLGDNDYKAIRKRSGFLPETNPQGTDIMSDIRDLDAGAIKGPEAKPDGVQAKAQAGNEKPKPS